MTRIRLPFSPYLSLVLLLMLGACSGMPPVIRDFPVVDMPYQLVNQNTDGYQGTPVRWGGTVIEIENEADSSLMQVVYYPLDRNGFPNTGKAAEGRFAVRTSDFLDPAILAKDRKVTIIGTLAGGMERMVGNKLIRIPLLASEATYLWPEDDLAYGYGRYPYGSYSYPYHRWGWHPYGWHPHHRWGWHHWW